MIFFLILQNVQFSGHICLKYRNKEAIENVMKNLYKASFSSLIYTKML